MSHSAGTDNLLFEILGQKHTPIIDTNITSVSDEATIMIIISVLEKVSDDSYRTGASVTMFVSSSMTLKSLIFLEVMVL
jgi:hypothetical protein